MKRWLIMIGVVVAMVAVIGGIWGYNVSRKIAAYKAMGTPQQTVTAMRAQTDDWRQLVTAVGSLHAVRGADLSNEVAGVVDAIHFESGADVKEGTLLVELRAADDIGKLESLRANADLAHLNYQRAVAQFDAQAISKSELETQQANAKSAKAQVAEQQAIVDKKRIRAPFSGHIGIRNADPGQYLAAGSKLVTLQTLDPIHVDFYLPQQQLATLRTGQSVTAISDTFPTQNFTGRITAIDPKVDTETRNVQVRATLQNPKHQLLPGMYINLKIEIGKPEKFITLPLTAVTYNPYGATVYLATTKDKLGDVDGAKPSAAKADEKKPDAAKAAGNELFAKQIFVTTGPTRGDQVAIVKGIEVGDQVVTSGQLKIKNGSPLNINNAILPANDPDPRPSEE
ncbi:MAG TPA: efflux RND transporter periplasmic adaptor subunit [Spongiibacteraceae bacterium]|nr:efflux RND transporter periplasmic adaptor subunit [Spongiibacteraceae bacterium]